jgi:hypothetical protein
MYSLRAWAMSEAEAAAEKIMHDCGHRAEWIVCGPCVRAALKAMKGYDGQGRLPAEIREE